MFRVRYAVYVLIMNNELFKREKKNLINMFQTNTACGIRIPHLFLSNVVESIVLETKSEELFSKTLMSELET